MKSVIKYRTIKEKEKYGKDSVKIVLKGGADFIRFFEATFREILDHNSHFLMRE